jgi:hypothetical protein|tara:strand:- start:356 stop:904 length:549 start_codon:yes stop_codon:yes gene_type:complete
MIKIRITEALDLDQYDEDALRDLIRSTLEDMDEEALKSVYSQLAPDTLEENIIEEDHYVTVDENFELYEALQDAIDENSETPCPQCLYEILSDASCGCPDLIPEAEYQGRKVTLNKPMKGDVKKSKVYVKNAKGNVVKVNFGDKNMKIKKNIPARRKSFRARHNCKNPGPKWKARYWSCKAW